MLGLQLGLRPMVQVGVAGPTCNPSTWEAVARSVHSHPWLQSEFGSSLGHIIQYLKKTKKSYGEFPDHSPYPWCAWPLDGTA